MSVIEFGKGVMLQGEGKMLKYIRASKKKEEFTRKHSFNSDCLLGKSYGTAFQIKADCNLEIINPLLINDTEGEFTLQEAADETNKDNRNIDDIADSQNQKLTKDDIMSLQDEGASGKEIIQELIENSSTFNDRTEFSKKKYLQKKKKKYVPQFIALKPTARLLSEMYFSKNPQKILSMRPDTIAQILTHSNVQADSKILVFEHCQGMLAGAVLERLCAGGKLIQLYRYGSMPVRQILEQFNYTPSRIEENICSIPLDKIESLDTLFKEEKTDDEIITWLLGRNALEVNDAEKEKPVSNERKVEDADAATENMSDNRKRKYDKYKRHMEANRVSTLSKEQRVREVRESLKHLRSKNIHGLIIASKFHPKNVLITLLKLLPPSSPFVVYFPYKEPLMECYVELKELQVAVDVQVTESWFRNITVLPNRTRPINNMSGSGGYILRGITVE